MSASGVLANARCKMAPLTPDDFLVTGEAKTDYQFCLVERSKHERCGPDAKLFEPKEGV